MSILKTIAVGDATGRVAEEYAGDISDQGYVGSHTKVMALNIDALDAFDVLIGSIARGLGKRRYELVTLAAALGAKSQHCRLAHGRRTLKVIDEEELVAIARDYHAADLPEAEVLMMEFAERVSRDPYNMTDADSQGLRDAGFTDREILDIALAAAARNYYSRAIQALAVEVEPPTDISDRLRDALVRTL